MTTPTDTTKNIQSMARDAKGHLLPKVVDTPMKPILDALNGALIAIRKRHPEVPNAVLVIGTSSTKKYGHFAPESWEGGKKVKNHEIMLSGESLQRGAEATLGTLIHECGHALANSRDIKDTSRQGRFHNEKFKHLAEELGIVVEKDSKIGWSITTLPKPTAALYADELKVLRTALKTWRGTEAKKPTPKVTIRVECGCRKVTLPLGFYDKGDISCEECGEVFLPLNEPKSKTDEKDEEDNG